MINLTQHKATESQIKEGVDNLEGEAYQTLVELLTFKNIPTQFEVDQRAKLIADLASSYTKAMIGGANWLMSALEKELVSRSIQPAYAFSERKSVDIPQEDGSVKKVSEFVHVGFFWVGV